MADPIGIIGKSRLSAHEERLLTQLGRVIGLAGKTLCLVPAPGTAEAVEVGVKLEGGTVNRLDKGVLTASAHVFVYADERLMARLRVAHPNIDHSPKVTLLSSPLEIEMWLAAATTVLNRKGITFK